ncbi:SnoaL-like domain-containing protein [Mesonia phycicola]|uniref:SnoaL-like domain-containing protein n=1 Tax=Mesonia phycicola TaxID=579105 RepID=A0A1M6ENW3_9FLAO|nr:nuclear transport factor 2 family protein [Mesonia phycicola]SHI87116.1 SnoaL-like domain-containing protein [Mesonia phycicola]
MKNFFFLVCLISFQVFSQTEKDNIDTNLNLWHQAAAEANFEKYFGLMTKDAVFIGTDASENWNVEQFKVYAKPHFDKGKAWKFIALQRNIYHNSKEKIAWFDELLQTDLGLCRGSGVLQLTPDGWKIKHYVLSVTIPNENVSAVKKMNQKHDQTLIPQLK